MAEGSFLYVDDQQPVFSFWPTHIVGRKLVLQSRLFVTDPWPVIRARVGTQCPPTEKESALAFVEQSHDYYMASAVAGIAAAKPVLIYYCFLNLAKAFVLSRRISVQLDKAKHGLSEQTIAGQELTGAYLTARPTAKGSVSVFDELLRAITGRGLTQEVKLHVPVLLPQIVPGHRLWNSVTGEPERFLNIDEIQFMDDERGKALYFRLFFNRGDVSRLRIGLGELLNRTKLASLLGVEGNDLCSIRPLTYIDSPKEVMSKLAEGLRIHVWQTVLSVPPYRRYYLYGVPPAEADSVLPQLLSIYAVAYYLSSITRYRPDQFDRIIEGSFGPVIESFLSDQPSQFLFLMASEFARREVARAALV